jgi:hypothetical protein
VHLFEDVPERSGYRGQMICTGFEWVNVPDREKKMRKAIVFEPVPLERLVSGLDMDVTLTWMSHGT